MNIQIEKLIAPIYCVISKDNEIGFYVSAGFRRVRIDRMGLSLFLKHKWIVTYAHYYMHRWEPNSRGRRVDFHREILQLQDTNERVGFLNGNPLDCRLCNLDCILLHKFYVD